MEIIEWDQGVERALCEFGLLPRMWVIEGLRWYARVGISVGLIVAGLAVAHGYAVARYAASSEGWLARNWGKVAALKIPAPIAARPIPVINLSFRGQSHHAQVSAVASKLREGT